MRVVAHRHVLRFAAATQRDPRVATQDRSVLIDDFDQAAYVVRAILHGADLERLRDLFRPATVESIEMERSGRTPLDGVRDRIGVRGIHVDPRTATRIEDAGQGTDARRRVDAA